MKDAWGKTGRTPLYKRDAWDMTDDEFRKVQPVLKGVLKAENVAELDDDDIDFPNVKSYTGKVQHYAFEDAHDRGANLLRTREAIAKNRQRVQEVQAQLAAAARGEQLGSTRERHNQTLGLLQEEDADLRFIGKVLSAKEEVYAPVAKTAAAWYTTDNKSNAAGASGMNLIEQGAVQELMRAGLTERAAVAEVTALKNQAVRRKPTSEEGTSSCDVNEEAQAEQRALRQTMDKRASNRSRIRVTARPVLEDPPYPNSFRKWIRSVPPQDVEVTKPSATPSPRNSAPLYPSVYPHPDTDPAHKPRDVNEEAQAEQRAMKKKKAAPAYITDQHDASIGGIPFGPIGNMSNNGCGAVAYYNVLQAAGIDTSIDEVMLHFNLNPNSVNVGGFLGANPAFLGLNLRMSFGARHVFPTRLIKSGRETMDADAYIVLMGYKNCLGAHYIAVIRNEDGSYTPLNDSAILPGSLSEVRKNITDEYNLWYAWRIDFDKREENQ